MRANAIGVPLPERSSLPALVALSKPAAVAAAQFGRSCGVEEHQDAVDVTIRRDLLFDFFPGRGHEAVLGGGGHGWRRGAGGEEAGQDGQQDAHGCMLPGVAVLMVDWAGAHRAGRVSERLSNEAASR